MHKNLNPNSVEVVKAQIEPSLSVQDRSVQFERLGYFSLDIVDHSEERTVFNRIVTLRDSWAKIERQAVMISNQANS